MDRKDLIKDLKDAMPDGFAPEEAMEYIAGYCELCQQAADMLEQDELKFQQLSEINDEMTRMVMVQSRHLREYEEMFKVRRLRGI